MERIKNIGLVVAVVLSCIALWNWGTGIFKRDLKARLDSAEFALPPQLEALYKNVDTDLSPSRLVPSVLDSSLFKGASARWEMSDAARKDFVSLIADVLNSELDINVVLPHDFIALSGYWSGTITNSGSTSLSGVQLYLNGARFALIQRDDNTKKAQEMANIIDIGNLRPGEVVQIGIWSIYRPALYGSGSITLNHSVGVGRVTISRNVTGVLAILDKYDFVLYGLFFGLFVVFVIPRVIGFASKLTHQRRSR